MQKAKKKMAGTTQKESASKAVNPDELYAQPDKSKKKTKEKEADKDEGLNTTCAPDHPTADCPSFLLPVHHNKHTYHCRANLASV